jgi:3-hydroxymyristoyl/3-hydroxydecanoyl-(acyl carrier protein) dehydratase
MTEDFVVERVEVEGDRARLRVIVPADLRYFEGHFEGRPMLPGIAQLVGIAHQRGREVFGDLGRERRMARVKFEAVIHPGDALDVVLERSVGLREGETQVRFEIARDGARCASGVIVYAR